LFLVALLDNVPDSVVMWSRWCEKILLSRYCTVRTAHVNSGS
jgi:hypothetical protein